MAFSMAGLASTMQGYDQANRQRQVDAQAARNAQRDERKFEQEQKAADEQSRTEAILKGEEQSGLSSATAGPATNGSRIVDAVKGLFGAAPVQQEAQQPTLNPTQQPDMPKGQSGLAQTAPVPLPYHKQAQARLDAYAAKNPNDVNAIQAAQAKIDILAKSDADRSHTQFVKYGEGALQKFIASGGMNTSALDEVTTKHFPDGHTYATARNDDGTYTVTQTDTGMKGKPMTFDEIGQKFSSLLHPDSYMSAHIKAQEAGLIEGAKLPSQIGLKNVESKNKISEQDAKQKGETQHARDTGVVAKNAADVNQSNASAGLSSASAGEKNFDVSQKRELAKVNAEIAKVDEVAEPSRYKELLKKQKSLEPRQTNVGGLHTTIGEKDNGDKVPIITDPVTGKVYQGGNVIYDRSGNSTNPGAAPALPKGVPAAPKGFKPL